MSFLGEKMDIFFKNFQNQKKYKSDPWENFQIFQEERRSPLPWLRHWVQVDSVPCKFLLVHSEKVISLVEG
jgi:hypothetical protein